jgi:septal ring factor EnvC (AmiA/AmiB activator)
MEDAAELLAHLKNVERFIDETRTKYSSIGRLIEDAQTRISDARQTIASNDELRRQSFSKYNSALEVLARHGIKDSHRTS